MDPWPTGIGGVTLFVEDLDAAKASYQHVFVHTRAFEDEDSAACRFGPMVCSGHEPGSAP